MYEGKQNLSTINRVGTKHRSRTFWEDINGILYDSHASPGLYMIFGLKLVCKDSAIADIMRYTRTDLSLK